MFNSDEDSRDHIMIGEAAMHLIFNREEISLSALINQLQSMAVGEEDDERLLKIWEARKWLLEYRKGSSATERGQNWLASLDRQPDASAKEADIRLNRAVEYREKE